MYSYHLGCFCCLGLSGHRISVATLRAIALHLNYSALNRNRTSPSGGRLRQLDNVRLRRADALFGQLPLVWVRQSLYSIFMIGFAPVVERDSHASRSAINALNVAIVEASTTQSTRMGRKRRWNAAAASRVVLSKYPVAATP